MTRRKPVAVHKLQGTYRPDRHRVGIQPPEQVPACPDWLGPVGKQTWESTVDTLREVPGLLTRLDGDMLALYCEAWEEFRDAREQIAKEGSTCAQ